MDIQMRLLLSEHAICNMPGTLMMFLSAYYFQEENITRK